MTDTQLSKRMDRLVERAQTLARSRIFGSALAVIAVILVWLQWRGLDFSEMGRLTLADAVYAAAFYAVGVLFLAVVPAAAASDKGQVLGASLTAQLLKYVPGGVWQAQPIYSRGGGSSVLLFALGVLSAAGLALVPSGSWVLFIVGIGVVGIVAAYLWVKWGAVATIRTVAIAALAFLGIGISGAFVGSGLGLDAVTSAREVAGAWGLGVVMIPVPAGIGVRELYISIADTTGSGPLLALTHRGITLAVDVAAGLCGYALIAWMRRSGES